MSLTNTMLIGRSALTASQLGLSVTGNNLANLATPGYSRQVVGLQPLGADRSVWGLSVGQGVGVRDVRRQVDSALQARLWSGVADEASAAQKLDIRSAIESVVGELSGNDLSAELSTFFSAWSEKSNGSQSASLVVQQGDKLASFIKGLRSDLAEQRTRVDQRLGSLATSANDLLARVAELNGAISTSEVDGSTASGLRDQRDQTITQLSQLFDVTAVEQPNGSVDLLVGSTPIVLGSTSRGVELVRRTENGNVDVFLSIKADGTRLDVNSGSVGALHQDRTQSVDAVLDKLDSVASRLIFEVNKLHSTATNLTNPSRSLANLTIPTSDRSLALNDPANTTFADLPFKAVNGGFLVTVKQASTGATQTVRIDVDLDGITAAGTPGTADDTSAEDVRSALDAVPGLNAVFNADGKLEINADQGFEFSFADDTSGALAVLGVNSYFVGTGSKDIGVRSDLKSDPSLLLTGRMVNGTFVQNGTSLGVLGLQDKSLSELGNRSLRASWADSVQAMGVETQAAADRAEATMLVRESLESQRASISGVSVDEESINLITYQQQYQGAARLISVAQQLTETLLALI